MILIPGGSFIKGIDRSSANHHRLSFTNVEKEEKVYLPPYYIDIYPVSNAEYDQFVKDVGTNDELFRHPDQKPEKNHMRNTYYDERFEPDHPVTGIDWYDAYAYAKWAGKELPTEEQWEKAARGADGRIYPWGNEFNVKYVNCLLGTEKVDMDLTEWRKCLCKTSNIFPGTTTYSIYSIPENRSPYGVMGMVGNCWEYTSTNYYTGEEMDPNFIEQDVSQFIQDETAYVVIKGGAWSSIPDMVSTWFRGKDLLTDRHNEIGFRCVKNIE
ncbi:hypothetical protein CU633_14810 [Bacillus sp. V3-13]|uniref:formylglycine-generating enzyme family protein n=1 Tax=Bacillus sp. V3-13 TaxID=2053728 RepID=UPI000C76F06B|nr:SUMF1/EgtB/PvdO family nonheme iron enzyme [Bacillus sp. V3-13]PLR76620.1 hypothetical protein CU633_14810 [Bacillus sp. V3-13]